MARYKNESPAQVFFFVSLETKSKAPVLRDAFFKTKVERRWIAVAATYPYTTADEFVVNDSAVHAIIGMTLDIPNPERHVNELLSRFQEIVMEDWKGGMPFWNPAPKVRRITQKEEFRSLRDFIVQKMLGGHGALNVDGMDEEEDDGYGPFGN